MNLSSLTLFSIPLSVSQTYLYFYNFEINDYIQSATLIKPLCFVYKLILKFQNSIKNTYVITTL